uniref:S12-ribonuclease n=1 Tax=Atalantia buxifolia TaxID=76974 RepID=A0A6B9KL53_9ROSI|nr:S12-ribonuclease [Atalantia buxifolia]
MKTRATYLFFYALLVSSITYSAAQNSSGFHHFWLVQVWPYGYCLEVRCARNVSRFVLHGLWPVTFKERTLPGTNRSQPEILESLKKDKSLWNNLMYYWLSLSTWDKDKLQNFWIYQWKIHGSAQQQVVPPYYFRRAVQLTRYTDLLDTLNRADIHANGSSYPKVEFRKAIKTKTGYDPSLSCVFEGGHFQLKEVIICVDAEATNFIPCQRNKINGESCRDTIMFPTRTK